MTTARRTQQQRRDQAETALLNAAAELAVEHGVRSLTLARVGERAGYSRGIVTHHFGSKRALLERLARATQTGFVPGLRRPAARPGPPPAAGRRLRQRSGGTGRPEPGLPAVVGPRRPRRQNWPRSSASGTTPSAPTSATTSEPGSRTAQSAPTPHPARSQSRSSGNSGIGLQRLLDPPAVNIERLHHTVTEHWRRALSARQT